MTAQSTARSIAMPVARSVGGVAFGGVAVSYLPDAFKSLGSYYGFRQAFADATNCVRVRRSSDGATQDIGFVAGYLDYATLLSFAGAGSATVTILYDHSTTRAKHINLVKTTGPTIVASGKLSLHDGRACWRFNGSSDVLAVNFGLSGSDKATFLVGASTEDTDKILMAGQNSLTSQRAPILLTGTGVLRVGATNGASGYNLWDRTAQDRTRMCFGVVCDFSLAAATEAVPFWNNAISTTGWTQVLNSNITGNNSDVVGAMGAIWDGGAGTPASYSTAGFDFASVFTSAMSEANLQSVAAFFGVAAEGAVIGDSTVAAYAGTSPLVDYAYSNSQRVKRRGLATLAIPGHGIAAQKTAWQAYQNKSLVNFVWVQVGLNDMDPAIATATTIAAYQDLIDTIRASVNPSCKIIGAAIGPAYERWTGAGWNQAQAEAKRIAFNDAIMNRGGSPITGVDYRTEAHVLLMSKDVSGFQALKDEYDSGDFIHPNELGKSVGGASMGADLTTWGLIS